MSATPAAESPPLREEAAPDRAASSGEEATQSSHTARLLASMVTKYASAEDNKGDGPRTIQQCVNFIKSDKAHCARILALRPLYAEAERLRLLYLAAREAQGHLSGKELDEATKTERAAYLAAKALYDKPKAVLPMFTTSGVFEPQRGNDYLATYTGLLQADFDHLTEKHVSLQWLRARAERDPHVLFVAESPSGDGLKAFVFVSTGPEEHPEAFQAMRRYCATTFGVEPDDGVKALAQPCFLPSDPLVQVNQNVQPLNWRAWVEAAVEVIEDDEDEDDASGLPLDAFPEAMQRLAAACAEVFQTDVALPAVSALQVMSAAFGAFVQCAGATNGRVTPCNLYTVIGAPSGYGKGVCGVVAKPLTDASHKLAEVWLNETRPRCRTDIAIAEQERKGLLAELKDCKDSAVRARDREKMIRLEADIAKWELAASVSPTLYTGSATGAALVEAMLRNEEQVFSFALEAGDAIRVMGGRYTADQKGDYDLALSSYSGEPFAQSRKGSGQVNLKAPCMNILWSAQPSLLSELYGTAEAQERGVLARFNVIRCDDDICPLDDGVFREVPPSVAGEWEKLISAAIKLRATGGKIVFQADPDARELFRQWHNEAVELRNGAGRESEAKLKRCRENAIRIGNNIAGTEWLQAGQLGGDKPQMTAEHAARGIAIARYFLAQTLNLTRGAVAERRQAQLADVLGMLTRAGGCMTLRELRRSHGIGENQAAQTVATSAGVLKIEMHKPPGRDRSSPCLLAVKK